MLLIDSVAKGELVIPDPLLMIIGGTIFAVATTVYFKIKSRLLKLGTWEDL